MGARRRLVVLAVVGAGVLGTGLALQRGGGAEPSVVSAGTRPPATTTTVAHERPSWRDPASIAVLVDKEHGLPPGWVPPDLVEPDVPFTFVGEDPKRLVRREVAVALEALFAAAARDGVPLAAVSGYRSEQRQRDLYELMVDQVGRAEAERRSARPGHSEHQTGLAVDITGADGRCPAEACFAGTPAARWLVDHAPPFGFVIRYPADKVAVTGYAYEPWHLRYLGVALAREATARHLTLEELVAE